MDDAPENQSFEPTAIKSVQEATAETVFHREFSQLKKDLEEQKKLSWQIVIGVAVAFLLTIGLVGVEIMLFHTKSDQETMNMQNKYFQEIQKLEEKAYNTQFDIEKQIEEIKAINKLKK